MNTEIWTYRLYHLVTSIQIYLLRYLSAGASHSVPVLEVGGERLYFGVGIVVVSGMVRGRSEL